MTSINDAPSLTIPSNLPVARPACATVPFRFQVYLACTVLALVTNYLLGKDIAWDTFDYHLYAGFSALNDRFRQDYFAAGPQSYFNPYIYVPFYALVAAGLSALQISSLLALLHSTILWLTYELAVSVCPSDDRNTRLAYGICGIALAYANPILIQQIGSTFADITTAQLVLAGWLLLASAVRSAHSGKIIFAGVILGAATALKLTNAVHALAAMACLVMLPLSLRKKFHQAILYSASLGFSFALVIAPWAYRLEQMFGNPLFPFVNGVFRSPEYTTEPLRHFRFIPDNLAEALWRPLAIVNPVRMVQEELRAPDLRYLILEILFVTFFLLWIASRRRKTASRPVTPKYETSNRVLKAFSLGFCIDWIIWLIGSGNGRYFLPMACISAVLIVGLLFRLSTTRPKIRNYILLAILMLQAVQLWKGTDYRRSPMPWGGSWLSATIPEELQNKPYLYLTEDSQSNSFIAPFLPTKAGLVYFSGGYALGPQGASGAKLSGLITRYAPNIRVLLRGERVFEDDEDGEPHRSQVDVALERFKLRVDTNDCPRITVEGLPSVPIFRLDDSKLVERPRASFTYLLACRLEPDGRDHSAQITEQREANVVLDRLEDACPKIFQPRRPLTEHLGKTQIRLYLNTDVWAWVSDGWVKFFQAQRGKSRIFVGRESDWIKAPMKVDCGRRDGRYYATVVGPSSGT